MQIEKSGLEEVCKGKDEVLAAQEQELATKERALSNERQRVRSLTDACATFKGRLEGKTEEIESLQAHVETVEVWQNICEGWESSLVCSGSYCYNLL